MVHGRLLLPALALIASGCSHTRAEATPDGPVVRDITITGARRIDDEEIKKKILTSETPWWGQFWPFHDVHYFDPNTWQADLTIVDFFFAMFAGTPWLDYVLLATNAADKPRIFTVVKESR